VFIRSEALFSRGETGGVYDRGRVTEPRGKPGRPPLDKDDPSVTVTVSLPSKQYDELYTRAQRADVSIPEIIRRHLRRPEKPQ
jgi:hypothetical protein